MIGRKKQKKKAYTNNQNDNTENRAIKEMVQNKTGITLVALVITIVIIIILSTIVINTALGDDGLINSAQFASFAAKVKTYEETAEMYALATQMREGIDKTVNVYDTEEIKNIINGIEEGDANKYVIQKNELRYRPEEVTEQEKTWLEQLGILAMTAITLYTITYMANGTFWQTGESDVVVFPEGTPEGVVGNFAGWYYDADYTNEAHEGDEITGDISLYGRWGSWITNKLEGETISREDLTAPYDDVLYDGEILYEYEGTSEIVSARIVTVMNYAGEYEREEFRDRIELTSDGKIIIPSVLKSSNVLGALYKLEFTFEDGSTDEDEFRLQYYCACLAEGTKITLADHTTKNIEDITYEDKLLVWDFDNGCFAEAKPLWIKKKQVAQEYNLIKFDNGTELKTVIDHRIYNMEAQKFTYTMNEKDTPIGTTTFLKDGSTTKLVERKVVEEPVNYYNIITDYHMNLFANGILTSLRLNNLYKIENMKFVKDNRKLSRREEYASIPDKLFYGLRLAEQPKEVNNGNDVKHTKTLTEYVERLVQMEK